MTDGPCCSLSSMTCCTSLYLRSVNTPPDQHSQAATEQKRLPHDESVNHHNQIASASIHTEKNIFDHATAAIADVLTPSLCICLALPHLILHMTVLCPAPSEMRAQLLWLPDSGQRYMYVSSTHLSPRWGDWSPSQRGRPVTWRF